MNPVSAERLLRALWKEPSILRDTLSMLTLARVALPWRSCAVPVLPDTSWHHERRDITGRVIARVGVQGPRGETPVAKLHLARGTKKVMTTKADVDKVLRELGWIVVDLPRAGGWKQESSGAWVRMTSTGEVVARVTRTDAARRFTLYMVLDEEPGDFEGTEEKAKSVLDRKLRDAGFVLGVLFERCVGCGAEGAALNGPCVLNEVQHSTVMVDEDDVESV